MPGNAKATGIALGQAAAQAILDLRADEGSNQSLVDPTYPQTGRSPRSPRILIGIHFRRAVDEGIEHGRRIGARAARLFLRPVH